MKELPKVSLILLNYNGRRYLGDVLDRCLASILKTDYPDFEVIFFDNGSVDGSVDQIERKFGDDPRLKILRAKANLGYARGNNEAVLHVDPSAKYVVLLNNDVEVERDWLRQTIEFMEENPDVGALQPIVLSFYERERVLMAGMTISLYGAVYNRYYYTPADSIKNPFYIGYPSGCAFVIRRSILVGFYNKLFDDDYFAYYDDADLGWRIWLSGSKCVCNPRSRVFHVMSPTASRVLSESFHERKNMYITMFKNLEARHLYFLAVRLAVLEFVKLLQLIYLRRPKIAYSIVRALGYFLRNFKSSLLKRYRVQSMRRVTDDYLVQHGVLVKTSLPYHFLPRRWIQKRFKGCWYVR